MVASFVRKRSILRDAKFPKDFIGPQYDPAQKAAVRYLAGGAGDRVRLASDIDGLLVGSERSRWFQQLQKLCEQAIKCVLDLEASLRLEGLQVGEGCDSDHRLEVSGVAVRVVPDLINRGVGRAGPFVGAMKFRYVMTKPINDEWAGYSATILHQFVDERLATGGAGAERRQCRYVDVFAGKAFEAPECYKERRKEVDAACLEIRGLWPSVELDSRS
jgi:hypothetical protein